MVRAVARASLVSLMFTNTRAWEQAFVSPEGEAFAGRDGAETSTLASLLAIVRDGGETKALKRALGGPPPCKVSPEALNAADAEGFAVLHRGIIHTQNPLVVRLLVSCGANPQQRAQDVIGGTALHMAVGHGKLEMAHVLMFSTGYNKSFAEAFSGEGHTALHVAAWTDMSGELVRLLVESGADLERRNPNTGDTALHYAASECCWNRTHPRPFAPSSAYPLSVLRSTYTPPRPEPNLVPAHPTSAPHACSHDGRVRQHPCGAWAVDSGCACSGADV